MATGDPHTKFREDRSSGSRDMLVADKQTDRNTLLPYRGGVNIVNVSLLSEPYYRTEGLSHIAQAPCVTTRSKTLLQNMSSSVPWTVRSSWLENAYSLTLFPRAILTSKVCQSDLVLVCNKGSLVGLGMQDNKSLCAAAINSATLVNIQAHTQRQHFDQLI